MASRSRPHGAVRQCRKQPLEGRGAVGRSEHREILHEALTAIRRGSLKALLRNMPDAGNDADFTRPRAKGRKIRL